MSPATAISHHAVAQRFRTLPRSNNSLPVTSEITPDAQQRADEVKTAQVRAALAKCSQAFRRVGVHVDGTLVRLTGLVTSYYQKQQATVAVLSLDDVERLENELQVYR